MTKTGTKKLNPESDEFKNMFDNITPEDFIRDTSAVERVPFPKHVQNMNLNISELGFTLFLRTFLDNCRRDAVTSDDFTPRAVLVNTDEQRIFHGEGDEAPVDFANRLQREAIAMNAHWMAVALVCPARAIMPGQTPPDVAVDDLDAIYSALEEGELSMGICWTAHRVGGEYHGGIIHLTDDGRPGEEVEGVMDESIEDPFRRVLS